MTDLQNFIELYKSIGIELTVIQEEEFQIILIGESCWEHDNLSSSKKFKGYSGFFSKIEFDKNGNFISQGFWE